jgi:hypothetical protein
MFRSILAIAVTVAITSSAYAAKPVAAPDFSRARCENPKVIEFIKSTLLNMKSDGHPISPYLGNNANLKASTVGATRDRLVCSISVNVNFPNGIQSLRGRFTIRAFPGGPMMAEFAPNY